MPMTTAMSTVYAKLKDMDARIQDAETHLKVLKMANMPGAMALETSLTKAKTARKELMDSIEHVGNS